MDWNYGGAGAVEVHGALENGCHRHGVLGGSSIVKVLVAYRHPMHIGQGSTNKCGAAMGGAGGPEGSYTLEGLGL